MEALIICHLDCSKSGMDDCIDSCPVDIREVEYFSEQLSRDILRLGFEKLYTYMPLYYAIASDGITSIQNLRLFACICGLFFISFLFHFRQIITSRLELQCIIGLGCIYFFNPTTEIDFPFQVAA